VTELSMAHGNRPPETVHAKFVPFLCDEMFQFLSNVTRFLGFFFGNYHKLELLTFTR